MVILYRMRYSYVADHWVYFGSMSLFALLGAGIVRGWESIAGHNKNTLGKCLAVALLAVLGTMTWAHTGMFDNYEALWRSTIAANPASGWPRTTSATNSQTKTAWTKAWRTSKKAMEIRPDYALAMANYGNGLMKKHDVKNALIYYETSLALRPNSAGYPQRPRLRLPANRQGGEGDRLLAASLEIPTPISRSPATTSPSPSCARATGC